jgi:glutaredoxin
MGCRGVRVTLYSRPGCHLCDEARDAITSRRRELPDFELEEVNIEGDPDLHARYLERIPVIEVEGEVVCELHLDLALLRSRLDTVTP